MSVERLSVFVAVVQLSLLAIPRVTAAQWDEAAQEATYEAQDRRDAEDKEAERIAHEDYWACMDNGLNDSCRSGSTYDSETGGSDSILADLATVAVVGAVAVFAVGAIASWMAQPPDEGAKPAPPDQDQPQHSDQGGASQRPTAVANPSALPNRSRDEVFESIAVALLALLAISALYSVIALAVTWRLFCKAGKAGWYAMLPGYNWWLFLEISGMPGWLVLLPFVNVAVTMLVAPFELASRFGRSGFFALGLIVAAPIFYPLLAFGSSQYNAPRVRADLAT